MICSFKLKQNRTTMPAQQTDYFQLIYRLFLGLISAGVLWIIWPYISNVVLILVFAFLFTTVLLSSVDALEKRIRSRGLSVFIVTIGVPLLVLVGFVHFKRSHSFKSEADVLIESNPYQRRNTVNSEIILRLNLQLMSTLLKVAKKEDLSEEEIEEITQLHDEILKLSKDRTLTDNIDMNFLKKEIVKL